MSICAQVVIYCDGPDCVETFADEYTGINDDRARVRATRYAAHLEGWTHRIGRFAGDYCPKHKEVPQ